MIGGTLAATLIAIFLIPATYYVVERVAGSRKRPESQIAPANAGAIVAVE